MGKGNNCWYRQTKLIKRQDSVSGSSTSLFIKQHNVSDRPSATEKKKNPQSSKNYFSIDVREAALASQVYFRKLKGKWRPVVMPLPILRHILSPK